MRKRVQVLRVRPHVGRRDGEGGLLGNFLQPMERGSIGERVQCEDW
jgi:hypothetical protein